MSVNRYFEQRLATDPEFRAAVEELEPEFQFVRTLIGARLNAGLTQQELAAKMGTSQSAIARLEGGGGIPNTRTLMKLAQALNIEFHITPDQTIEAEQLQPAD